MPAVKIEISVRNKIRKIKGMIVKFVKKHFVNQNNIIERERK